MARVKKITRIIVSNDPYNADCVGDNLVALVPIGAPETTLDMDIAASATKYSSKTVTIVGHTSWMNELGVNSLANMIKQSPGYEEATYINIQACRSRGLISEQMDGLSAALAGKKLIRLDHV